MSMPVFSEPPQPQSAEPAGAAPASEPAAPAAQPSEQQPATVHPAWDKALEGLPPLWADRVKEQIRTTETEHQRAIEQARTGSVPESWRELYDQAEAAGLSPDDFVNSYNGQQTLYEQLRTDPDQFLEDMRAEIDRQVAAGQLTRAQGREAHQAANQAAVNAGAGEDLLTPEQQELQELRQRLDQRDQQELTQQQQWEQQQILEQADQEGETFVSTVHAAFDNDPNLAGASGLTRQTVAQIAAGLIDADDTGRLSYEQAVGAAMNQLRESVGLAQLSFPGQQQGAQQQQQQLNPAAVIGGGSQGFQQQAPTTFDLKTAEGRDARDAMLVQKIEAMNAQAEQGQ